MHRLSLAGKPLNYVAVVGTKLRDVPKWASAPIEVSRRTEALLTVGVEQVRAVTA